MREDAEEFAREEKGKLRLGGERAVSLTEEERILFQSVRDRLARAGAKIDQAADYYLEHHKPLREPLQLGTLLEKAVLDKELAGHRAHSISQFACSCRSFIRGREGLWAHEVTKDEVKRWIHGQGFAPKTQRVYLGDLRALLAWAVLERYLHVNPIAGEDGFIQLTEEEEKEIEVFDPEHCRRLLRAALFAPSKVKARAGTGRWRTVESPWGFRPLIGYIAAAMFAGVRPEENRRTAGERIDVRGGTLVVTGAAAKRVKKKGRQRRVIELPRTALIWLRLWRQLCPGAPLVPKNFKRHWKDLRAAAAIGKWPHDVLRHTFATYHYAMYANRAQLQAIMGHSADEDTLDQHYRAVMTITGKTVSKRLAEEFWGLTPRRVRLLALPGA